MITRGILKVAQKVLLYGVEGIGKTSLAAQFPDPVFIDTEGSTNGMDVKRLPKPTSWAMLQEDVKYVLSNPDCCGTLIIDTMDWAEALCNRQICDAANVNSIEAFGYGKGYTYSTEEMQKFLYLLDEVIAKGIHIVLTAHAQIRKFEQPDEMGAYDRYELKLGQKTSSRTAALLREWADMVLFANYETYVINADEKGNKKKAQGSRRVMYTTHHACWDAKNRHGLDEKLPLDYKEIAHIFTPHPSPAVTPSPQGEGRTMEAEIDDVIDKEAYGNVGTENTSSTASGSPVSAAASVGDKRSPRESIAPQGEGLVSDKIPKALVDLMNSAGVTASEIEAVVEEKGVFPKGMPLEDYDIAYINGVLIGAWPQVLDAIMQKRTQNGEADMPWEVIK